MGGRSRCKPVRAKGTAPDLPGESLKIIVLSGLHGHLKPAFADQLSSGSWIIVS
jgi:hypothetical protein